MLRGLKKIAPVVAAAALVLTGCASVPDGAIEAEGLSEETLNDPVIPTGPGGAISIEAGDLFFQNLEGTAVDGPVEVTLINIGNTFHDFTIDEAAGENKQVGADAQTTVSGEILLFGPGTYTYYCSVPGHRAAGMEGTLEVLGPNEAPADAGSGADEAGGATEDEGTEGESGGDAEGDAATESDSGGEDTETTDEGTSDESTDA